MLKQFTKFERILWGCSCVAIVLLFFVNVHRDVLTLLASLLGATMLIYLAKGHPAGQLMTVVFALLYAVISYRFQYYGEMITYLGMTAPTAAVAAYQWFTHPYEQGQKEVRVAPMTQKKLLLLLLATLAVTGAFYVILRALNTSNLIVSTISVATSFMASGFTVLRSPYYALAYSANDVVLIVLWALACRLDMSYLPMVLCFGIFLINDFYGFVNWQRMARRQAEA